MSVTIKPLSFAQCGLPLISIIIPVYNGSNFLWEAINSALAQTYKNFEVIVVNDGSSDGGATERIALSYGDRIRYFNKINGGVASALNLGIREMSGHYFSWLSHDDVYYPDKLAAQVAYLEQLGRSVVLYSDYDVIDAQSNVLRKKTIQPYKPEEFSRALVVDNVIQGCSALVPRECFARVGLFNETLRTTQDYDMWFRIARHYDFVFMPRVLLQSREHIEQGTKTMTNTHIRECNEFLIDSLSKLFKDKNKRYTNKQEHEFIAECIYSFLDRGFHKAAKVALEYYVKSLLINNLLCELKSIKPILTYILVNFRRVISVLTR